MSSSAARPGTQIDQHLRAPGVLRAMRTRGLTLHLEHCKNGTDRWVLSDGSAVRGWVAAEVLAHPKIVGCGGLFAGLPGQSYRWGCR
jgi:hypothetical protein